MAPLKISIPSTHEQTPDSGKPYTAYTVRTEPAFPRAATTVSRRYSDFAALDRALRAAVGSAPPVALPPKSWGIGGLLGLGAGIASPAAVEKRRAGLEQYLRAVEGAEDGRWRASRPYRDFLQLDDPEAKTPAKHTVRDASDWLDKHAQAKRMLQDARRALTAREQATSATAQHEAAAAAKKSLLRAATLLAALDHALAALGGDEWSGEKLGDGEIRRRRDMISSMRKEKDGLESVLNSMAVQAAVSGAASSSSTPSTSSAAVTQEQKASLFRAAKTSGRRVLGPPHETERTRELDNEGVLQMQKQIIHDQDEDLVDLTTVVRRIKDMGVAINTELVEQNALLGLLDEDVERVDGKIKIAKKRMAKIQ
ncbi:hypothetical protein ACEQ8H_008760 [Pleosporales sp. CAS-2024a]